MSDGIVYVATMTGTVSAFDSETGESLWESETDNRIESSPAVKDGTVYALY